MIKLKRDNLVMEVSSEIQASAFINNGWVLATEKKVVAEMPQPTKEVVKEIKDVKRKTRTNK